MKTAKEVLIIFSSTVSTIDSLPPLANTPKSQIKSLDAKGSAGKLSRTGAYMDAMPATRNSKGHNVGKTIRALWKTTNASKSICLRSSQSFGVEEGTPISIVITRPSISTDPTFTIAGRPAQPHKNPRRKHHRGWVFTILIVKRAHAGHPSAGRSCAR